MSRLSLSLLGSFHAEIDGKPIIFSERKAQALLAYCAVEVGNHERTRLAGLLWPEESEETARQNLRRTLHRLRETLGDESFLHVSTQSVAFNRTSEYQLDVEEFQTLVAVCIKHRHRRIEICSACASRLERAAALVRGPFLQALTVDDSPEYEQWMLGRQAEYQQQALEALETLSASALRRGDFRAAQAHASRHLALDPLSEIGYRASMRALALAGQRTAALAQFEACRQMLAEEFDAEPEAETAALYAEILAGKLASAAAPTLLNSPGMQTVFVGREAELEKISDALQSVGVRLLTLVGPGGIGKTRLALAAAAREAFAFRDGAVFVPLAAVSEAEFIAPALAAALHFRLAGRADPLAQVIRFLRGKEMLLVLDNLEHLLPENGLVSTLLEGCPSLTILATSRERLQLAEEWALPVGGFEIPQEIMGGKLEDFSAVQLFVLRARQMRLDYQLSEGDLACVREICVLVDGMPLALEMAAGWASEYACSEIVQEIKRSLEILRRTLHNVPERHRSMRAAFEYSWALLSESEQNIFRQVSVFAGGFTDGDASHVLPDSSASLDVVLPALVAKSLLQRDDSGRYSQHPLIRQFGAEKLAEVAEIEAQICDAHAQYFLDWLHSIAPDMRSPRQTVRVSQIMVEIDNVRAAWNYAVENGFVTAVAEAADTLARFYFGSGSFLEGLTLFERAVNAVRTRKDAEGWARGVLVLRLSFFQSTTGQSAQAAEGAAEALALLSSTDVYDHTAAAHATVGGLAWMRGDFDTAAIHYEEARRLGEAIGDQWEVARALNGLGNLTQSRGDHEKSQQFKAESLRLFREIGDLRLLATTLSNTGSGLIEQHRPDEARLYLEESVQISRQIESPGHLSYAIANLGRVEVLLGNFEAASNYLHEALDLTRHLGDQTNQVGILIHIGDLHLKTNDPAAAYRLFRESLELGVENSAWSYVTETLIRIADLRVEQGKMMAESAVEVISSALAHPALEQEDRDYGEMMLADLATQISAVDYAAAQASGRERQIDEVIADLMHNDE